MALERGSNRGALGVVDVEEVGVQDGLHKSGENRDEVKVALCEISVYPVRNIQRSVCAEGEQVMGGDCFCLSGALQHEQLREDGDGLEPDGEGPEHLQKLVSAGVSQHNVAHHALVDL